MCYGKAPKYIALSGLARALAVLARPPPISEPVWALTSLLSLIPRRTRTQRGCTSSSADIEDRMASGNGPPIDKETLKKYFDTSHFDLNAVIRGIQLTGVGGMISNCPSSLLRRKVTDKSPTSPSSITKPQNIYVAALQAGSYCSCLRHSDSNIDIHSGQSRRSYLPIGRRSWCEHHVLTIFGL